MFRYSRARVPEGLPKGVARQWDRLTSTKPRRHGWHAGDGPNDEPPDDAASDAEPDVPADAPADDPESGDDAADAPEQSYVYSNSKLERIFQSLLVYFL